MSKKKPNPGGRPKENPEVSLVRSSAAEYLTFVAAGGGGLLSLERPPGPARLVREASLRALSPLPLPFR